MTGTNTILADKLHATFLDSSRSIVLVPQPASGLHFLRTAGGSLVALLLSSRSLCIAKDFNRALRFDTNPKHGLTKHNVDDSVLAYRELTMSSSDNRNSPLRLAGMVTP